MKTALLIFVALLAVPQDGAAHFAKEGVAFDYPAEWTLADTSDAQLQRLMLKRAGASNIILVFAQRELITTAEQLLASHTNVTMPYVANIAHRLGLSQPPPPNEAQCLNIGGRPAIGFHLSGRLEGEPTTAEVYTVVLGQRPFLLVHIRADRDEAAGAAAWKSLLDTLKVDAPAQPSPEFEKMPRLVAGGVLNGKVLKKPAPSYPAMAKSARAQGTVTVRVVVDEKGDVVSAVAISGHPLLQPAGVEAARKAKFAPTTLCGQPVKVSGLIIYNFVLM